ncbi:MAG: OmpA family protein [Saprospiraceae bacterium]|nr:OmpA family protein [Saprospiraceae bacterium]
MRTTLLLISILIFNISFSQDLEPNDSMAVINTIVSDFENHPRKSEIIIFSGEKSKRKFTGISGSDGKFSLFVPVGDTYSIKYKNFGDQLDYDLIEIPDTDFYITMNLTIQIEPPKTYTLKNVLFDTGKSTLKKSSYEALNDLYEVMKLKENLVIEIAGHTDSIASSEFNQKLSEERAKTVRDYLIKKGIDKTRVTAVGYGETQPVADNGSEEGREKNRRTEVRIISE